MEDRELERRVMVDEDGVVQWVYDVDMWHDPYIFAMVLKIMAWIGLGTGVFAMLLGNWGGVPGPVMGLIFFAGFIVLWLIIYVIWAMVVGGVSRQYYLMTDEFAMQTYSSRMHKTSDALSALVLVAGIATGRAGEALSKGTNLHNATQETRTYFSGVKRVIAKRDKNLIVLKNLITKLQLLVPPEDYDLVLEYIQSRVPEKALDDELQRSLARGRRMRLLGAAGLSLALNLITVPINLASYKATSFLKLSWNVRGGDYGAQRAFGMLAEHWYSTEAPFEHRLSFHLFYAVFYFLIAFLILWLLLTIIAAIKRRAER